MKLDVKIILPILYFLPSVLYSQINIIDTKRPKIVAQKEKNLFITNYEYGQMLYKNPRGIGCIKCHNEDAKGKLIATYKTKHGEIKKIIAPSITKISYDDFKAKLTKVSDSRSIMPSYFLTNDEMKQIYFYITHRDQYEQ